MRCSTSDIESLADRIRKSGVWVSWDLRITEQTAAQLIGVTQRTLRSWRDEGRGPAYVAAEKRRLTYRIADVLAWIESRRADPAGK